MAGYHRSPGPFPAGSAHRGGDLEVGVSGNACSPPARRWGSYAALAPLAPTRSGGGAMFFFDSAAEDGQRHFLDACFLCEKPLGRNRDIYMYRGDTPFCSEECRQEQIEMDEARENSWSLSMKASAARKEQQKTKDTAAAQGIQVRTAGAVVAV